MAGVGTGGTVAVSLVGGTVAGSLVVEPIGVEVTGGSDVSVGVEVSGGVDDEPVPAGGVTVVLDVPAPTGAEV